MKTIAYKKTSKSKMEEVFIGYEDISAINIGTYEVEKVIILSNSDETKCNFEMSPIVFMNTMIVANQLKLYNIVKATIKDNSTLVIEDFNSSDDKGSVIRDAYQITSIKRSQQAMNNIQIVLENQTGPTCIIEAVYNKLNIIGDLVGAGQFKLGDRVRLTDLGEVYSYDRYIIENETISSHYTEGKQPNESEYYYEIIGIKEVSTLNNEHMVIMQTKVVIIQAKNGDVFIVSPDKLEKIEECSINIGDYVFIAEPGETYTTYCSLISDEVYYKDFKSGYMPPQLIIYKVIDLKWHENTNRLIAVVQSPQIEDNFVFLIGVDGLSKVVFRNTDDL